MATPSIAPSIEGIYQLVRRDLSDGTVQHPPVLKGLISFEKGFRTSSVVWKDEMGKYCSSFYAARYKLTEMKYSETQEYLIIDDPVRGEGITYDLSNAAASSPVSIDGGRIRLELLQPFKKYFRLPWSLMGPNSRQPGGVGSQITGKKCPRDPQHQTAELIAAPRSGRA